MKNAAIFVDLENCFNGLRAVDRGLAQSFMSSPSRWLSALTNYDITGEGRSVERRFVHRSLYYTRHFNDYLLETELDILPVGVDQTAFRKSEFEVKYLVPLTQNSKNFADMCISVDAMKLVAHYPKLDQVFIFSDDSDFSPLVRELCKHGLDVIITRINIESSSDNWKKLAKRLGATLLTKADFANIISVPSHERLIPSLSKVKPQNQNATSLLTTGKNIRSPEASQRLRVSDEDISLMKQALQLTANERQGFLRLGRVASTIREIAKNSDTDRWWGFGRFTDFIRQFCALQEWIEYDHESQGVRIINNDLDLSSWGELGNSAFTQFVREILVQIDDPIPFFSPSDYRIVFDVLSEALSRGSSSIEEFFEFLQYRMHAEAIALTRFEAEMFCDALEAAGYRIDEPHPAAACASAWRLRVFELARRPHWLTSAGKAELLAKWFSATSETSEQATQNFLYLIRSSN